MQRRRFLGWTARASEVVRFPSVKPGMKVVLWGRVVPKVRRWVLRAHPVRVHPVVMARLLLGETVPLVTNVEVPSTRTEVLVRLGGMPVMGALQVPVMAPAGVVTVPRRSKSATDVARAPEA